LNLFFEKLNYKEEIQKAIARRVY